MGKIKTQRRASPETTSDESGQVFLKKCPHCTGRLFKSQSDAARHLASHNPEKPEICIECGKGFAQKSGLKSHKNIHSGLKPYACQMGCKMRSGDPSSRNRHEREVHDPSYSHKCCKCGASLKRPGQFIKHFKTCFGRPPTKAEILAACEAHKDEYMEQIKSGQVPPLPEKTRDIQRRAARPTHADKDASVSLASSPDALMHRESRTDDDQNPAADLVNHHSNGDNARVDDVSDIPNDEPKAPSAPVRALKPAHDLSPLLTNFESSLPSAFQGSEFVSPELERRRLHATLAIFAMVEDPMRVPDILRAGSSTTSSGGSFAGSPPRLLLGRKSGCSSAELSPIVTPPPMYSSLFPPVQTKPEVACRLACQAALHFAQQGLEDWSTQYTQDY